MNLVLSGFSREPCCQFLITSGSSLHIWATLGNIRLAFCQGIEGGSDVGRGGGGGGEKEIKRERGGGVGGMKGGGKGELGTGDTSPIQ